MRYELRHYDVEGERGLGFVTRRFGEHVLPAFDRCGIEPVGFWTVFVGAHSPRLTYVLAWQDLAEREARWNAFETDPEWSQTLVQTNADYGGSPIRVITNTIMRPVPSGPLSRRDNQPSRLAGGVFEMRTFAFRDYAGQFQCERWFAEYALPLLEKHRMHVMGLWATEIGVTPRLTLMLVFENLADRERAWASYYTDPTWPSVEEGLYPSGRPLIVHEESCLMRGTEFSGWR
jgi:hypothetical protein